jgi:hypothetical protein
MPYPDDRTGDFLSITGNNIETAAWLKSCSCWPEWWRKSTIPFLFSILLRNILSSYAASVFIQKIPIGVLTD